MTPRAFPTLCAVLLASACATSAQMNVTTWQINNQHTGNNASETVLTPDNVGSPGNFGLLFSQPLDGQTYGQPLLVSGLTVGGKAHNVLYATTEHDSVYAYDADGNTGANANPLWKVSLLPAGTVPVPQSVVGSPDIPVELGITTTPVIAPGSSTLYVVSKVQKTADTTYHQYLYALDLATGAAKFGSPVEISVNFPGTATTDSVNGMIAFDPLHEHLRCAMALHEGIVYLAYASHSDTPPYHGEIIGYDATTLQVVKKFIVSPNGGGNPEGGIWQSGAGPAIDPDGNLYVITGNGAWNQANPSDGTDWGESMLRLPTTGTFGVSYDDATSWFTPANWSTLNQSDLDLGSGGLVILPDQPGPHQHLMIGGCKSGILYVVDRDNLGGMAATDNVVQEISESSGIFTTPSYFNGNIYYAPVGGPLEQRAVGYNATTGAYLSTSSIKTTDVFTNKGAGCFISSNNLKDGVVWALSGGAIRAYDATNVAGSPIYTFDLTLPGNISCQSTKFSLPIVANGKVYHTAFSDTNTGHLLVYGLLPTVTTAPAAATNAAAMPTSPYTATVTWKDNSTNESGFKIKRSTSRTGGFVMVGLTGAGVTEFPDTALAPLTTYYYQIVATNADGDSAASNVATATTFPNYTENGLVLYLSLDETSGTNVTDTTGHGHAGIIRGEAALGNGYINNGVIMHGTGQAASNIIVNNLTDLQFSATQGFSFSAWVLPSALRNSEETIIAKSRDIGNYYGVWINASNQWVFRGPGGDIVGPTATEGAWTHVAAVQNGGTKQRKLFINGALVATGAAQAADGAGALWIGQQNVPGNKESFPGTVDEIRVYDRPLADRDIPTLLGPPVLVAASQETQGGAGVEGITIWPVKNGRIESRQGAISGSYRLDLKFSAPVSGLAATLERQDGKPTVGFVKTLTYDATDKEVTVLLNQVGTPQALNLRVTGIQPGNGTALIPFNVLWGDVNGDGVVNALDASIVAHNHTSLVTAISAPDDINCDGEVDATDDDVVTHRIGSSLTTPTDTKLSLFQPVTASSSSGANTAALAVDNSQGTRWDSEPNTDPESIYVDLGTSCTIHSIVLDWKNAAKNYTLDVSNDASSWTPLRTITNNAKAGVLTYAGLNATGRYVRMNGTARIAGNTDYALYDFQVIGVAGTGAPYAPTVNSNTVVSATANSPFSYQITATNNPTSFVARNLPDGLSVNTATGVISGTITTPGTYSAMIAGTNSAGTNFSTLKITVMSADAAWRSAYFTPTDRANPAVSGHLAAPADDGVSNLMKYALDLDPKADAARGLPVTSLTTSGGKRYLSLTFTKVIAATDLAYTVEVSGDMQTWRSGKDATAETRVVDNPGGRTQTVTVQDLTPLDGGGRRFIRLKVVRH